jgi:hypothetical protein
VSLIHRQKVEVKNVDGQNVEWKKRRLGEKVEEMKKKRRQGQNVEK